MHDGIYQQLDGLLAAPMAQRALFQTIVNSPFTQRMEMAHLSLGIIVLLLVDKADKQIHRVALSSTEMAAGTQHVSVKRFEDIKIPLKQPDNIIAEAIRKQEPQRTVDWQYLFTPALTADEARLNQAGGAIACSVVYPLHDVGDGAAMIFSYYQYPEHIGMLQETFMKCYSALAARHLRASTIHTALRQATA
jgi:hypothetical protein